MVKQDSGGEELTTAPAGLHEAAERGESNAAMLRRGRRWEAADERPLVTFLLVAYNQAEFVEEATRAALAQTYSPLEILVSDDCSTDDTFARASAVVETYRGPHAVRLLRGPTNVGLGAHINALMREARGELIVGAAGDDVSLPERVERIVREYVATGRRARIIVSDATVVDRRGQEIGRLRNAAESLTLRSLACRYSGVTGCTQAWHRDVFEIFGAYDATITHEDHVIPFRGAMLGEVRYIPEAMVLYRDHGGNMFLRTTSEPKRLEDYFRRLSNHAVGNVRSYEQRLKDIRRASELGIVPADTAGWLDAVSRRRLLEMQMEEVLTRTRGRVSRMRLVLRGLAKGARPRVVARWLLQFVLTECYWWLGTRARARQIAPRGRAGRSEPRPFTSA